MRDGLFFLELARTIEVCAKLSVQRGGICTQRESAPPTGALAYVSGALEYIARNVFPKPIALTNVGTGSTPQNSLPHYKPDGSDCTALLLYHPKAWHTRAHTPRQPILTDSPPRPGFPSLILPPTCRPPGHALQPALRLPRTTIGLRLPRKTIGRQSGGSDSLVECPCCVPLTYGRRPEESDCNWPVTPAPATTAGNGASLPGRSAAHPLVVAAAMVVIGAMGMLS